MPRNWNPPNYGSPYSPEYSQAMFETLRRRIEELGGQYRSRAIEELAGAGRYGGGLMAQRLGEIDEQTMQQLSSAAQDIALEVAEKKRQERLIREGRAWQEQMMEKQYEMGQRIGWKDIIAQLPAIGKGLGWLLGRGGGGGFATQGAFPYGTGAPGGWKRW